MTFASSLRVLVACAAVCSACTTLEEPSSESGLAVVSGSPATDAAAEARTAERLDALRASPAALETFLRAMPKGGDLHSHLSGAVYAESYLTWALADGLCVDRRSYALVAAAACSNENSVALPTSPSDPLYRAIVQAWSMEGFVPSAQESGHDHFFATFGKFGLAASKHSGDMVADVANRAAADTELYLELMLGISAGDASKVGSKAWTGAVTKADLAAVYDRVIAHPEWNNVLVKGTQNLDRTEAEKQRVLQCGTTSAMPGCSVTVRYLFQVSRTGAPQQVFASFIAAFELAMRDHRVVGLNLVAPEDAPVALRDYSLQMAMLDFLHDRYAGVSPLHVALHAGELTEEALPPGHAQDLTFHIREAVQVAHAERIGHGVDVLSRDDSAGLRAELAKKNVLVEMCLTSNAVILEVEGTEHPMAAYLASGVPLALATDDQGVSRSDITEEYRRAVVDQQLDYRTLKLLGRNSLEHSFLPGESLWASIGLEARPVDACGRDVFGTPPTAACSAFLAGSERARMQWALEERVATFERTVR